MKRKFRLEADLDPVGTPRTRPGGETVKRARALAKGAAEQPRRARKSRPGAYAAERALAGIRSRRA